MRILGLIPARGGSKGIPRKNIVALAGKPLLAYTCEAALGSHYIDRVVLSTDDEEIARIGRDCGVEVPFMRPTELARDDTPSLPVAQHAIEWLREHEDWDADILVLLQPTSPLRRAHHIDAALDIMLENQADTVVSVVEVPHRYNPYSIMELKNGLLQLFLPGQTPFDRYRRQTVPKFYARNGPAVLITKVSTLFRDQSYYGALVLPYVMDEIDSLDIDTPYDLEIAEFLIGRGLREGF